MLKKIFFPSILIFFFLFFRAESVSAQGTCACVVNASRMCGLSSNSCETGYQPHCTSTITQCNNTAGSCICTGSDPVDGCGAMSEECCSGNTCDASNLTCHPTANGNMCLTDTQIGQLGGGGTSSAISDPTCGTGGIDTAIGCIPVGSPKAFTIFILKWALGLGGLIAMLFIVYAGFLIMTSSGNPKQVAAGKELLTASVSGLGLLILAAFLLNFIGVSVLGLPGF